MREGKTEALVLDTRDVFDMDRTYLLYTREFGKIWARAKGVRRPGSRLTGHLLPYVPTALEIVRSGSGYLITQAQVVGTVEGESPYPEQAMAYAEIMALIAEVIDGLSAEHDPHPLVFETVKEGISIVNRQVGEREEVDILVLLVVAEVVFKILAGFGYQPELEQCVLSGERLHEGELLWSNALGGVAMAAAGAPPEEGLAVPIRSPRTVVVLRQFLTSQYYAPRLKLEPEVAREATRLVLDYAQYQLGKPLKALPFLSI